MTRLKYLAVFAFTFLLFLTTSNAVSCDYKEKAKLNSEAANVKGNYEIKERVVPRDEYELPDALPPEEAENYELKVDYFQVNILNLTENLYVEVTNNQDNDKKIYTYDNAEKGNVSFNQMKMNVLTTYTVKIYSSNKTNCSGTLLKTIYIALPRYNMFSSLAICEQMPDYYLCKEYVTFEEMDYNKAKDYLNNEKAKRDENKTEKDDSEKGAVDKALDFVKENKKWLITGGIVLVIVAGAVAIVVIRNRRRDVL